MRLTLLFLSIFVATAHQQLIPQRVLEFPWLSSFARLYPFQYFNQFLPYDNPNDNHLSPENNQINEEFQPDLESRSAMENQNNFPDTQARFKQFKKPLGLNQQQNARFFFANSATQGNPILKTFTFTVSSTCTQINITSCIPAAAFGPAPGNFNPPLCRRKRDLEFERIGDNDQFPISPNEVELVVPTTIEDQDLENNPEMTSSRISSSIMEKEINHQPEENIIEKVEKEPVRKGRFYNVWQRFAVGTTVTSWTVTSSLLTQTFSPRPINGAILFLPCLPPGYFVCPGNGK